MSDYKYSYNINQFFNEAYNLSSLTSEIHDSNITVALSYLSGDESTCDIYFRDTLSSADWTTLSGIIDAHTGQPLSGAEVIDVNIKGNESDITTVISMPTDQSGKLRVHQTSRRFGTRILWTGIGDDISDITTVGGGEPLIFSHLIGEQGPLFKYIDLNIIENQTYIHEGYMTWKDCLMDKLTLQIVPRTVTVSGVVGGNKTVYGGYLVVPTAPGAGNYEVTSDLTAPTGGLIYLPDGDTGDPPNGYWDADYNIATHKFGNIRPNYTGTGRYHMFSYEIVFSEFVREIPLLASGFIALNSSDTDELGQGMRIKMIADTCTDIGGDHNWQLACILCLHREHSS